jgi:hypothetical protein
MIEIPSVPAEFPSGKAHELSIYPIAKQGKRWSEFGVQVRADGTEAIENLVNGVRQPFLRHFSAIIEL